MYVFIVMATLFFVLGGCCTGYWVFGKKEQVKNNTKIDVNNKISLKQNASDQNALMQFQNNNEICIQPTYSNGIIDFQNGKQVEIH